MLQMMRVVALLCNTRNKHKLLIKQLFNEMLINKALVGVAVSMQRKN